MTEEAPQPTIDSEAHAGFCALCAPHLGELRGFLVKKLRGDEALAEEMLQEVLLRTWIAASRVKRGKMRAWLFQVARNLLLSEWERRRVRDAAPLRLHLTQLDEYQRLYETERIEAILALDGALEVLPTQQRRVLELQYLEELKPAEIAARLGISAVTVRRHKRLGLDNLSRHLQATAAAGLLAALTAGEASAAGFGRLSASRATTWSLALPAVGMLGAVIALAMWPDTPTLEPVMPPRAEVASTTSALIIEVTPPSVGRLAAQNVESEGTHAAAPLSAVASLSAVAPDGARNTGPNVAELAPTSAAPDISDAPGVSTARDFVGPTADDARMAAQRAIIEAAEEARADDRDAEATRLLEGYLFDFPEGAFTGSASLQLLDDYATTSRWSEAERLAGALRSRGPQINDAALVHWAIALEAQGRCSEATVVVSRRYEQLREERDLNKRDLTKTLGRLGRSCRRASR